MSNYNENPSSFRPEYIARIRAEARGQAYRPARRTPLLPEPAGPAALFTVENGNRWLELGAREPKARTLFGSLWYENELAILFADTNVGKSILAVQLADNLARGLPTGPLACGAKPKRVLYVDFELTTLQFYQRYSCGPSQAYEFSDNFYRARYNPTYEVPAGYHDFDHFIIAGLESKIRGVNASVLIIDNITCLRGGTENAAVALKLMHNLKSLRHDCGLSILVLAHTPKRRNPAQPLSAIDLQGSKLLINFADSAFAIGASNTHAGLRYIKQIKQRSTQQQYGEGNVLLCRIQKPGSLLHFTFQGYSHERPHLLNRNAAQRYELAVQINQLSISGLTQRQISRELNVALGTVNKLMRA